MKLFKKLFKRQRKSRSKNFKMVGVYKEDHISLKVLAKEENISISALINAMIQRWVGMKYGLLQTEINQLTLEKQALIFELKKLKGIEESRGAIGAKRD